MIFIKTLLWYKIYRFNGISYFIIRSDLDVLFKDYWRDSSGCMPTLREMIDRNYA